MFTADTILDMYASAYTSTPCEDKRARSVERVLCIMTQLMAGRLAELNRRESIYFQLKAINSENLCDIYINAIGENGEGYNCKWLEPLTAYDVQCPGLLQEVINQVRKSEEREGWNKEIPIMGVSSGWAYGDGSATCILSFEMDPT